MGKRHGKRKIPRRYRKAIRYLFSIRAMAKLTGKYRICPKKLVYYLERAYNCGVTLQTLETATPVPPTVLDTCDCDHMVKTLAANALLHIIPPPMIPGTINSSPIHEECCDTELDTSDDERDIEQNPSIITFPQHKPLATTQTI
jgi:hypothetical protein